MFASGTLHDAFDTILSVRLKLRAQITQSWIIIILLISGCTFDRIAEGILSLKHDFRFPTPNHQKG
jgi:hypothetical protein